MKERPMPFSAQMVRAILNEASPKTQTRRLLNSQPIFGTAIPHRERWDTNDSDGLFQRVVAEVDRDNWTLGECYRCPYGRPGDRLWVRESWRIGAWTEDQQIAVDYRADNYARREWLTVPDKEMFERYWIQSTDDAAKAGLQANDEGHYRWEVGQAPTRWRPPRFMPRLASRILLEIKSVRVERLHNISEVDICAELGCSPEWSGPGPEPYKRNLRAVFEDLWKTINGAESWTSNPWVWAIEFARIPT